ncbi:MAG TPA: hypothetical protein VLR94_09810 [Acidobacteriota bacterium]|nr:hypothetical protein [Acidobacteriota bacterium]
MNQAIVAAALPSLYSRWMSELLDQPIPEETKATCNDCAMCAKAGDPPEQEAQHFNPGTKCCTYDPEIPNFLAGAILADADPAAHAGRNQFLFRVNSSAILRPQGVCPTIAEAAAHGVLHPGYGQDASLLCPFYLAESGGICGIWKHRNARCATWYCKHERGAVGRDFWRTLKELLADVEAHLSLRCIHALKAGTPEFRELFPMLSVPNREQFQKQQAFLYRSALPAAHVSAEEAKELKAQMWGDWLDREESFYIECARVASTLDWSGVTAGAPQVLRQRVANLRFSFHRLLNRRLPAILIPAPFRSVRLNDRVTRVWGYSNYDPVDIPASVLNALSHFDRRPTESLLESLGKDPAITLTPAWAQILYDFGILTSP